MTDDILTAHHLLDILHPILGSRMLPFPNTKLSSMILIRESPPRRIHGHTACYQADCKSTINMLWYGPGRPVAPVFSFNSLSFVSPPPRHADGTREGFYVDLSCHSAFFVSPPRHTGGARQVLTGGLPYSSICVSVNSFSSRFSWLHSQAVQRCGSGF